jgi:hypothetical protein
MAWKWIDAIRRNHALEHATVSLLLARLSPQVRLVGRAVPDGFYLYGDLPSAGIRESAQEGLRRLQSGESGLAVTALCGTNIAVAGILAGALSVLTMGRQRHLDRLPTVFLAAAFGVVAAQPLGRYIQQHVTTRPDLAGVSIQGVDSSFGGRIHKVTTTRA